MARDSLVLAVLDHMVRHGLSPIDLFFSSPHVRKTKRGSSSFSDSQRFTISTILSRLRKQGLVARKGAKKNGMWHITKKGLQAFKAASQEKSKKEIIDFSPLPADGKIRLVAFDIPEKWRRKRNWLRTCLVACHYERLQKSVWVGARLLPKEFIKEIDKQNLGSCVHIMSVGEKGTLEKE